MPKKILIVEDEKSMAHALELKLVHNGFEVKTAANGEEAISILSQGKFDLILLDLIMPKLDGFGVLAKLKELELDIPVIILSNLSQEDDERKARELGAVGFFIKSNTPISDIITRVKERLGEP